MMWGLLALALAVGLVPWGLSLAARGSLLLSLLVVLVSGICFGYEFFHISGGPLPVTLDRLLWLGLIGQTLLFRRLGKCQAPPATWIEYGLLGLAGYLVYSALAFGPGLKELEPKAVCLFFYLMPLGMYWVARQIKLTAAQCRWTWLAVAAFGFYLAFTAYAETHERWSWVFPTYVRSPAFVEFYGRGRGPLINPIGNGLLLIGGMCSALLASVHFRWNIRWPLWGIAAACLLGCYYTYTRSVWMGAGAALAILGWAGAPRNYRLWLAGGMALLLSGYVVTHWESLIAFKRDKDLSAAETADSVMLRPVLAGIAQNLTAEHPWFGVGLARYLVYNHDYAYEYENPLPLEKGLPYVQHNLFLSLLVETGCLGLAMYLFLLVNLACWSFWLWQYSGCSLTHRQLGLMTGALLAAYCVNAMFHELSLIPMVNMCMFTLFGLTMGTAARRVAELSANAASKPRVIPIAGWLAKLLPALGPRKARGLGTP